MDDEKYATLMKAISDLGIQLSDFRRETNLRFKAMQDGIDQSFDAIDKRFNSLERTMNRRFDDATAADQEILSSIGAYVAGMEQKWQKKWLKQERRFSQLEQ